MPDPRIKDLPEGSDEDAVYANEWLKRTHRSVTFMARATPERRKLQGRILAAGRKAARARKEHSK